MFICETRADAIRLGFAVRAVGRGAPRPPTGPAHLSVGLAHLGDMLVYLGRLGVRLYRMADPLPPGVEPFGQLGACGPQLDGLARRLADDDVRVTLHLDHGLALAGPDAARAAASLAHVEARAALLAALDAHRPGPPQGTMVAHLGAAAGDPASLGRFAARFLALSPQARARLAVEHDGAGFSLGQLLALHQRCGVAVVFDALHWGLNNPEGLPLGLALGLALATWPPGARAEVHLSSARSEAHLLPGRAGAGPRVVPPYPGQHADFILAADLGRLLEAARGLPAFDLMLEAKAGDLALLRLREELARARPSLAGRLG